MKNPFLTGGKIYLRPIEVEDAPKYVEWLNDGDVTRTLGRGPFPLNLDREKEWVEKLYKDNDSLTLAIVVKETDKLIGGTGFNKIDWVNRKAEFGIVIGDKAEWSKGYGTEATRLIVGYGFSKMNLHRIYLTVDADNIGGIKAYKRAGFVEEGRLREERFVDGAYKDQLVMGILEREWREGGMNER